MASSHPIPYCNLCGAVSRLYGGRLISLAIYGPFAAGVDTADSDLNVMVVARTLPRGVSNRLLEFDHARQELPEWLRARVAPVFFTPEEMETEGPVFLGTDSAIWLLRDDGTISHFLGVGEGHKPPRPMPVRPEAPRRRRRAQRG